ALRGQGGDARADDARAVLLEGAADLAPRPAAVAGAEQPRRTRPSQHHLGPPRPEQDRPDLQAVERRVHDFPGGGPVDAAEQAVLRPHVERLRVAGVDDQGADLALDEDAGAVHRPAETVAVVLAAEDALADRADVQRVPDHVSPPVCAPPGWPGSA